MTKRISKQDAGVALLEEPVIDERAPDQQPNEAARAGAGAAKAGARQLLNMELSSS